MRSGNIIAYILYFLLFFVLQIIFFRNVILFNYALCFIYIGYILILPPDTKPMPLLLIGFLTGMLVDSFYDTVGVNAFVSVLIAFIRPYVLKLLTPAGGYDSSDDISVADMGFVWFVKYAALLIFIHHFAFFFLEALAMKHFLDIMIRSVMSTLFTLFVLILLQFIKQRG